MKSRWSILSVALLALYLSMLPSKEPECALDYTANMTTEENIKFYGYPYEKHLVQTEDGYFLSLIRFPRRNSDKLPIIIVHGFMASSCSWVTMGPEGSLAYRLYDEGYDVWIPDLRGNSYSIQHSFLEKNDTRFWDFSFDEMGRFDQPAFIDYVLKETGHEKLVHVGYSMGSASFFIMNSFRPEYNDKVEAHIALAPAVFLKHSTSSYWTLFNHFLLANEYLGDLPGSYSHGMMPKAFRVACNFNFLTRSACKTLTNGILGPSDSNKNESLYQVILHNGLTGSSVKTAHHFMQLHNAGRFRRFDNGDKESNLRQYGQETPPDYDLSKTTVPLHIFYGATDEVCPEQDVSMLKLSVNGPADLILVDEPFFNHGDFFMSTTARKSLNPIVLDKIRIVNKQYWSKSKIPASKEEIKENKRAEKIKADSTEENIVKFKTEEKMAPDEVKSY